MRLAQSEEIRARYRTAIAEKLQYGHDINEQREPLATQWKGIQAVIKNSATERERTEGKENDKMMNVRS